ncbi:MAG: AraC family transcriptional regulator [Chloroflexota bacterium]
MYSEMGASDMVNSDSFVIHEKSRYHYWRGAGLLSIKTFWHGQAYYDIGQGAFLVDDASYLVLNAGQEYAITIDATNAVTSFCIFFSQDLVNDVSHSMTCSLGSLLDDPCGNSPVPSEFYTRTYPHESWLAPMLNEIRKVYPHRRHESGWLNEQYHQIMIRMLFAHQQTIREVASLPASRQATREELYRRLHLARDYVAASYAQAVKLNDIAEVACMSPNHLMRTFKQLFRQTPYQYLISERLRHAQVMLSTTDQSVTEICLAVGFTSLGSFSWLFRQRCGMSPQTFRAQNW